MSTRGIMVAGHVVEAKGLMTFWEGGGVVTFLLIGLLLDGGLVRRLVPQWAAWVRASSPSWVWLARGRGASTFRYRIVYHGLALTHRPGSADTALECQYRDAYAMGIGIRSWRSSRASLVFCRDRLRRISRRFSTRGSVCSSHSDTIKDRVKPLDGQRLGSERPVDGGQIGLIIAAAGRMGNLQIPRRLWTRKGWFSSSEDANQAAVQRPWMIPRTHQGPGALDDARGDDRRDLPVDPRRLAGDHQPD